MSEFPQWWEEKGEAEYRSLLHGFTTSFGGAEPPLTPAQLEVEAARHIAWSAWIEGMSQARQILAEKAA